MLQLKSKIISKVVSSAKTACFILLFVLSSFTNNETKYLTVTANSAKVNELYSAGLKAMKEGNTEQSKFFLHNAVELDSCFFMGNFQLLLYDAYLGNEKEMMSHLKIALTNTSNLSEGEKIIAGALRKLRNNPQMNISEDIETLTQMFPNDEQVWYILASLRVINQQYDEALTVYRRLLKQTSNKSPVYNRIGYINLFLEDFSEAEKAFNKYIQLSPNHPNPWDSKGDYFMQMNEFEQAYGCYMRAYSINTAWGYDKAMRAKWKSLSGQY